MVHWSQLLRQLGPFAINASGTYTAGALPSSLVEVVKAAHTIPSIP